MTKCSLVRVPRSSANSAFISCGLTASKMTLQDVATSRLWAVVAIPVCAENELLISGTGSLARQLLADISPADSQPLASAVAILPAPMKPIRGCSSDMAPTAKRNLYIIDDLKRRLRANHGNRNCSQITHRLGQSSRPFSISMVRVYGCRHRMDGRLHGSTVVQSCPTNRSH